MAKFKAYVKVPADSRGKIKKIITETIEANSSFEALSSLRGQYGASNVNIVSQVLPKHKPKLKTSNIKNQTQRKNYNNVRNNNQLRKSKLLTSKKLSSSTSLVNDLEKTPIGRMTLAAIGLIGFAFVIFTFLTSDNNVYVGVYNISGNYGSDKTLINTTSKKIIMKDEVENLNNNNSKYLEEFNKIDRILLCKEEKISNKDCETEILKYAICNYEFNLIKIKYFRSVLSEVENHIDWKGRVQEWQNKYGSRYDYSINVKLSFFQTFEEQKKSSNYEFFCK